MYSGKINKGNLHAWNWNRALDCKVDFKEYY